METSEEVGSLAGALAKAQGAIKGALKDSANPHFKSKYADLSSVWEACRDALSANALSVAQFPGETAGGVMTLTTMLMHSSGEWLRDTMTVPLSKVDAQGLGSALTYARRYALAAVVGIAPEDDDGNSAVASSTRTEAAPNNTPKARQTPPPLKAGPMKTRAEARLKYSEIVRELHSCEDSSTLDAYLLTDKPFIDQFEAELPDAWNGDGQDFIGLKAEIDLAKDRIAVAEIG